MVWGSIVGGVISFFTKRGERKDRLREAKLVAEEARIAKGMDSSGWKDEWLVLLISMPYIMAFIPHPLAHETATKGFKLLAEFPDWWTYTFISIVGAVFGVKKLLDWKGGMR